MAKRKNGRQRRNCSSSTPGAFLRRTFAHGSPNAPRARPPTHAPKHNVGDPAPGRSALVLGSQPATIKNPFARIRPEQALVAGQSRPTDWPEITRLKRKYCPRTTVRCFHKSIMSRRRKIIAKREKRRFTPDHIVRAIAAVKAAGLKIYSVEITRSGAINIRTQPFRDTHPARPNQKVSPNLQDDDV